MVSIITDSDTTDLDLLLENEQKQYFDDILSADGEEALNLAWSERPALIIMDGQLPKMSGLEVTRKLRETPACSHTPIIGLTAYAMKGDKERSIESGCDVYLSKPINTRALPGLIALMLSREQKTNSSLKGDDGEQKDPHH